MLPEIARPLCPGPAAQQTASLSKEVQKYVRIQAPRVVLEHVRIVDGTGRPPVDDENVIVEGGKIAPSSPAPTPQLPAGPPLLTCTVHRHAGHRGHAQPSLLHARPNQDSRWNDEPPLLVRR